MMLRNLSALLIAIVFGSSASAQAPRPLFASDQPLRLTIQGPITKIAQSGGRSREPRNAVLMVSGAAPETLPIQLSPRGITRLKRDVCQFPPLRVRFQGVPGPASLFSGQRQLKLVTHCRSSASFQQHLLLEYAAYRLYNQLSPASFRARLATIDYVDEANRPITSRLGFFIEDVGDVAARNGVRAAVAGERVPLAQLSAADSARVAMFNYMIGNRDFSVRAGPPGDSCCHNSRLIGPTPGGKLLPVPYDFDFSGLVDAPYATSPDGETEVTNRRYMGYCAHNAEAFAAAASLRAERPALLAILGQIALPEPARRRATAFLEGFFNDIMTDRGVSAKLLATCLK